MMATTILVASPRRLLQVQTQRRFLAYAEVSNCIRGCQNQSEESSSSGGSGALSSRPYDRSRRRSLVWHRKKCSSVGGRRNFSDWTDVRGHDLIADQQHQSSQEASLHYTTPPKIVLHGYGPTGFDVMNALKNVQQSANDGTTDAGTTAPPQKSVSSKSAGDGILHMNGSILVFPRACFLWNVRDASEITLASLSPVLLHQKPSPIAYLFIGINNPSSSGTGADNALDARIRPTFQQIQNVMYKQHNVVVEVMDLLNAIGTFNVLNAEDRMVAAALLLDPTVTDDEDNDG